TDPHEFVPAANPNLLASEAEQVDILNLYNDDSVADRLGSMTDTRITGLGLGPDRVIGGRTYPGGITYENLEMVRIDLGRGNDRFVVNGSHGGATQINAGP